MIAEQGRQTAGGDSPEPGQATGPWRAVVERVVEACGLELVQAELVGGGRERVLRVFLDQPGGIALADCERVSRALSAALDEDEAAVAGSYTLEVSSPGLDRPLTRREDFERFAGQRVRVRTRTPLGGARNIVGELLGGGESGLRLRPESVRSADEVAIGWDNLEMARLAPRFSEPARRRK